MGQAPPPPAELERFIGPPLRDGFRELLGEPTQARVARAVELYRQRFATVGMFENRVYDGIPECLESLARTGRRLYVATSKPTVFAARILEHFGLARYFHGVLGCELDGRRSAKREVIADLLAGERIPVSAAVMVGDRRHDIEGARANLLVAVGVSWGFGGRGELETAAADAVVDTPGELAARLLGRELRSGRRAAAAGGRGR